MHDRSPRDHLQVLELAQVGQDILRYPIAEPLVVRVIAHVVEGQYGYGGVVELLC